MGGERFEIAQPEAYLFGENSDLNLLSPKPVQFPTFQSSSSSSNAEAIRPLHCLIALRKDSLKFVRQFVDADKVENANDASYSLSPHYSIEFAFDCDSPCVITIYYFATDRLDDTGDVIFLSKRPNLKSRAYHYDVGCHVFRQTDSVFDPSLYSELELLHNTSANAIPIVIHCAVQNQDPSSNFSTNQSCIVYANVEKSSDGQGYLIKMLKQKLLVDGIGFLIQEVYGVENKRNMEYLTKDFCNNSYGLSMSGAQSNHVDDTTEPTGECVVCMSDLRDTLILPCRHLCICSSCAETLRYKANNCPICRSPFRALLQAKAMRKFVCSSPYPCKKSADWQAYYSNYGSSSFTNNRYELVPLYEALNGAQDCTASSNSNNNFIRSHKSAGGSHRSQHSRSSQAASAAAAAAASSHSHHNNRPPRAAPRRNHRRKRQPKPVIPIQEVLTPQALNPKNAEKNDITTRTTEMSGQSSLPGAVRIVIVDPQPYVSEINVNNFAASLSNRSSLDTLKNAIPMVDFTPNMPSNVENFSPSAPTSPKNRLSDTYFEEEEDLKSISSQEDNGSGGDEDDDEEEEGAEEDYASFSDEESKTLADRESTAVGATPSSAVLKLDDESGLENDENCIVGDITRRSKEKRANCPKMDETALSSVSSASGSSNKALLSVSKGAKIEL